MTYSINAFGGIVRDTDSALIPPDPGNIDYQDYLTWSGAGNSATPAPVPSLVDVQNAQIATLSAACQDCIYAGFTSSALGSEYSYPAKDTDQQNLTASVLSSLMPNNATDWSTPFWCADANGNWSFQMHTAAQIQQVGIDGKNAILTCMAKNQQLAGQVMAAKSVQEVQAITWA